MFIEVQQACPKALHTRHLVSMATALSKSVCASHLDMCMNSGHSDPIPSLLEMTSSTIQSLHHGPLLSHHHKSSQGLLFKAACALSSDALSPRRGALRSQVPGFYKGPGGLTHGAISPAPERQL